MGEYQHTLRMKRSTSSSPHRGKRWWPAAPGSTCAAALALLDLPAPHPSAGERERWEREYDADPRGAYGRLVARDAEAAERVHPNRPQAGRARALELSEAGTSAAGRGAPLGANTRGFRPPSSVWRCRWTSSSAGSSQRTDEMFARGVVDEVRTATAGPVSKTAEKALGPARDRALPAEEAASASS